ncbi:hypothetical protein GR217_22830 [Rhizobium leguminosarum]|uniref:Integrase n=1 Tax=Rhizobium ruizarguesonis TaxID=2081791 RepID=A0AAE4YUL9_9HYPH|nr:VPA1269 family protein [Rhizobium ruizarguesonis]NEI50523.1 hypothetical protein [Rhizobium ruizarguesonis]
MEVIQNVEARPFYRTGDHEEALSYALSTVMSVPPSVRAKLNDATSYAVYDELRDRLRASTRQLIRSNQKGDFRMSFHQFTLVGSQRVPFFVTDLIVEESLLGSELRRLLKDRGVEDLVFGKMTEENVRWYRRAYHFFLASLVMTSSGARTLSDLGAGHVSSWLSFYYNAIERSFRRPDILGHSVDGPKKVLKLIAKTLGRELNEPALVAMGRSPKHGRVGDLGAVTGLFETPPQHLRPWVDLWKEWRSTREPIANGPYRAFATMAEWLDTYPEELVSDPARFLRTKPSQSLLAYARAVRKKRKLLPITDNSSDEVAKLRQFSQFLLSHVEAGPGKKLLPLISEKEWVKFQNDRRLAGKPTKHAEATSVPLPMRHYFPTRAILEEGADGWPGTQPRCWCMVNGKRVYNPVLPNLFLVMYELAQRSVQIRRFDSGEGDPKRFDGITLKWVKNDGPHAGYWLKRGHKRGYRGYAQRTSDKNVTGIGINTNKTGKPFVIPWQGEVVHRILYEVALFQITCNPITGPITPREYHDQKLTAEDGALDRYPDIFPLFRMPPDGTYPGNLPVSFDDVNSFWLALMWERQKRYNASVEPEDQEFFVTLADDGKTPISCDYNTHGMRVMGLMVMVEAGLPFDVISKYIAGHKTLLMTIYYLKFDPALLNRTINKAALERDRLARNSFFTEIKRADSKEVTRRVVANSEAALAAGLNESGGKRHLWLENDLGICMTDGQGCKNGGPCLRVDRRKGKDVSVYGPVEGHDGNCILCRHFLTGPKHAFAIWSKGNVLSRSVASQSVRINELLAEEHEIRVKINQLAKHDPARKTLKMSADDIVKEINQCTKRQTVTAKTFVHAWLLLRRVSEMDDNSMLAHPEACEDDWPEVSEIEQAYRIAATSTVLKSLHDPETQEFINRLAHEICIRSGKTPLSMTSRTKVELERDSRFIVEKVIDTATSQQLRDYDEGRISISDLVDEETADRLIAAPLQLMTLSNLSNETRVPVLA